MNAWKEVKVGDLGKVLTGKTPKTSETDNYGGDIPFITPSDDMTAKYIYSTNKKLTKKGAQSVKNNIIPERAICVSCIGSDLGKVVISTERSVTNQQINSIIINEAKYDVDYIYYVMTMLGKTMNHHSKTSTAVPIVNKSQFSEYTFLCPELKVQKKIGEILSSIDSKIMNNEAINRNLQDQALAIYHKMFVEAKNESRTTCRTDEFFDITIGKTPPRKEKEWFSDVPSECVWISISDMGSSGTFINDSSEYLTPEAVEKFNVKVVPDNTVILSFKLTVGRIAITVGPTTTNEAIAHFSTGNEKVVEYLYCYLKSFDFGALGSTSSIGTAVNSKTIKAMDFVIPEDGELREFYDIVHPMFQQIKNNQFENQRLIAMRDSLLPKLMSGELDVSDIEL